MLTLVQVTGSLLATTMRRPPDGSLLQQQTNTKVSCACTQKSELCTLQLWTAARTGFLSYVGNPANEPVATYYAAGPTRIPGGWQSIAAAMHTLLPAVQFCSAFCVCAPHTTRQCYCMGSPCKRHQVCVPLVPLLQVVEGLCRPALADALTQQPVCRCIQGM
jgi:hypothetical protein